MLPHNNYLQFWFDLGLIGLVGFVSALGTCVGILRSAALSARGEDRDILIAISVGVVAGIVAVFFVDAQSFWPYFWMLAALGCRIAFSVSQRAPKAQGRSAEQRSHAVGLSKLRDPYGWHH